MGEEDAGIDVDPHGLGLRVRGRRVQREHFVGIFAEVSADLLLIVLHRRAAEENERRALLGIEAVEDGLLVVLALLISLTRCLRQHITVHGHVVDGIGRGDERLRIERAQLFHL